MRRFFRENKIEANVQRATFNVQRSIQKIIERCALSVERWTFLIGNEFLHAFVKR
jgi:hypothetical protein